MSSIPPLKPHLEISELIDQLEDRGMIILDRERAERKLYQIGYYRLSGFWYPCRRPNYTENGSYVKDSRTGLPIRSNHFQDNVYFNDIINLYLFDKKLRLMFLDAIERIEIYIRNIIAHEIGRLDPLAYQNESYFNPKILEDKEKDGLIVNYWRDWQEKHNELLGRSKQDSTKWHKMRNAPIPIWVAAECWDFGLMSKFLENLNGRCQNLVIKKIGLESNSALLNWLTEINHLRNQCAHHCRIWNYEATNPISLKGLKRNNYFKKLRLSTESRKRVYGHIAIIWYLVKMIGPSSKWLLNVADLIDSKPQIDCCPYTSMGFNDNTGFPRATFGLLDERE